MAYQVLLATLILLLRAPIAALFVEDPLVLAQTTALMPITTAYSVLATLAPGWSQQLLFGLGDNLRLPAGLNFVSFFCIGVPTGSVLAFAGGLGARGLWAGLVGAMVIIVVGQYTYIATTTDWPAAAERARTRALENDRPKTAVAESDTRGLVVADSAAVGVEMEERVT